MKSIVLSIGLITYVTSTHLRGYIQPTYQATPYYSYMNPMGYSPYLNQPYAVGPSTIQSFMLHAGIQSLNDNANVNSNQNIIGTATASYGSNANTSSNNKNGASNYSNLVVNAGLDQLLKQANALKELANTTTGTPQTNTAAIITSQPIDSTSIPVTIATTTNTPAATTTLVI